MSTDTPLIEIYKLHADLADRTSQKRIVANQFYLGIISAIFLVSSFIASKDAGIDLSIYILGISSSCFGFLVSIVWLLNIHSLSKLNQAKFTVLHQLEQNLPFAFFTEEWNILRGPKMLSQSTIERVIPVLFLLLFIIIIVFCFVKLHYGS